MTSVGKTICLCLGLCFWRRFSDEPRLPTYLLNKITATALYFSLHLCLAMLQRTFSDFSFSFEFKPNAKHKNGKKRLFLNEDILLSSLSSGEQNVTHRLCFSLFVCFALLSEKRKKNPRISACGNFIIFSWLRFVFKAGLVDEKQKFCYEQSRVISPS